MTTVFAADLKVLPLAVFGVVLAITLGVTYWAAKRTSSASDFYAAGRGITGFQNGWAIAGDYMSASSFLGFAGLGFLFGVDAFVGLMAAIIAFVPVLFFLAERMRNSGKFTLADVLSFRLRERPARLGGRRRDAVGGDHLPARADGGRRRADPGADRDHLHAGRDHRRHVHARLRDLRRHARHHVGADHQGDAADDRGRGADRVRGGGGRLQPDRAVQPRGREPPRRACDYLKPGLQFDSGLALLSFGIAFVFGTAGLPHILMRFFTVPNAKAARGSVGWAVFLIGTFYLIVMFVGVGARAILTPDRGQGGGRDRQPRDPRARRASRRRQGLHGRRHLPGDHLRGRAGDDPRGRGRARDLRVGRGRARRVVQRGPQGPRLGEGGGLGREDLRDRDRRPRDRARAGGRRGVQRLRARRPRVLLRLERDVPGAAAGAVVARVQHHGRDRGHAQRPDGVDGADHPVQPGVAGRDVAARARWRSTTRRSSASRSGSWAASSARSCRPSAATSASTTSCSCAPRPASGPRRRATATRRSRGGVRRRRRSPSARGERRRRRAHARARRDSGPSTRRVRRRRPRRCWRRGWRRPGSRSSRTSSARAGRRWSPAGACRTGRRCA